MSVLLKGFSGPMGLFTVCMAGILIYNAAAGISAIYKKKTPAIRAPVIFTGAFALISVIIWGILITDTMANVSEINRYKIFTFFCSNLLSVLAFAVASVIIMYALKVIAGLRIR